MTTVTLKDFLAQVDSYLAVAARDTVVVTQDGKPWIVLHAAGDNGDADFAQSCDFWQMIHERRNEQGIPWQEARKQLDID